MLHPDDNAGSAVQAQLQGPCTDNTLTVRFAFVDKSDRHHTTHDWRQ